MAAPTTNDRLNRLRQQEEDSRKVQELMVYYATGGGKEVPVERVASHLGIKDVSYLARRLRELGRTE